MQTAQVPSQWVGGGFVGNLSFETPVCHCHIGTFGSNNEHLWEEGGGATYPASSPHFRQHRATKTGHSEQLCGRRATKPNIRLITGQSHTVNKHQVLTGCN